MSSFTVSMLLFSLGPEADVLLLAFCCSLQTSIAACCGSVGDLSFWVGSEQVVP